VSPSASPLHHALARQFAEAYERIAAEAGWDTNPASRFVGELPAANRAVVVATVEAVLAMPEMQAIRSALASMSAVIHEHLGKWHDLTATDALVGHLGGGDDPDSVQHIVDWVMDGEQ
jgi:hypothetical protein